MCFVFSLIPAHFYVIIGYLVLFASSKAEDGIKKFGQILAAWIFLLALLFPIVGAFITLSGICPMAEMLQNTEMPFQK